MADSTLDAGRENINMMDSGKMNLRLRLLVAIANYGDTNLGFLKSIVQQYQEMPIDVDVVVFTNAPKNLGDGVKVVVGLPSKNPRSLPFAHKAHFAQNVEQYDLFIYSEDDIEVTIGNIQAFLHITPQLESDEIAGHLRYEFDRSGAMSLPDVHGAFYWKAESVRRRGTHTVAEFTNEHAGFYILTQAQLRRAIASGGFLVGPCDGRYGMLETAATDPYTGCGFRKVICISALKDFLVHHMSNRYVGQLGLPILSFEDQIKTLMDIGAGQHPAKTLLKWESKMLHGRWSKSYYEKPASELLAMVPANAKAILSIGCGWGDTEDELKQRGAEVIALPLDSVIGAVAAARGIKVIYGTWDECLSSWDGRRFDCVLMRDLLHLQANPGQLIEQCSRLVKNGGTLVLAGPNFSRVPWFIKRLFGIGDFRKLKSFDLSGITVCGPESLARPIRNAGLRISRAGWFNHEIHQGALRGRRISLGKLTAREWVLQAQRDL